MGMTMTQKILAAKAGLDSVVSGQLIECQVDMVLANDITGPVSINEFEKYDFDKVFDKEKITLVMDHFAPNKDIKSAQQCRQCRNFAKRFNLDNYYDVGEMGIEHVLLPEKGLVKPGDVIIGADSHTCTYGALACFSTGVGSSDVAAAMASGKCWFKVPEAIKIELKGKFRENVSGKDLILTIIGMIGVDGALYKSMEFTGGGVKNLTMDDRLTVCNMAIEAGAKNGIFPFDSITEEYVRDRVSEGYRVFQADDDAQYAMTLEIDLGELVPTVAYPHLPENTHPASEGGDIKIDQVVIGSCTNGRLSDLKAAAEIIRGNRVAKDVRVIVIPGSNQVYLDALKAGYIEDFINAGCIVSTPTCGPCLGGHMGILAENERCVSTTNRNFIGRMGHNTSEIYLASPATAAMSALTGYITSPDERRKP